MPTVAFTSFGSKTYQAVVDRTTYTWYVHHLPSDTTTYRFVCSEGMAEYLRLKRYWRQSRQAFEARCAAYDYYPD